MKQFIYLGTIKTNDDFSADVDDRHAALLRSTQHITRSRLVTGYIDILEPNTFLSEVTLGLVAE